jgi:hypothetical protein
MPLPHLPNLFRCSLKRPVQMVGRRLSERANDVGVFQIQRSLPSRPRPFYDKLIMIQPSC